MEMYNILTARYGLNYRKIENPEMTIRLKVLSSQSN